MPFLIFLFLTELLFLSFSALSYFTSGSFLNSFFLLPLCSPFCLNPFLSSSSLLFLPLPQNVKYSFNFASCCNGWSYSVKKIWTEFVKELKNLTYNDINQISTNIINVNNNKTVFESIGTIGLIHRSLKKVKRLLQFLATPEMQKVTSHPVHIMDEDGQLSPTALIPFCSVSNNYSTMGTKIHSLDVPVCTHVIKRYLLVLVAINILGIISVTEGS